MNKGNQTSSLLQLLRLHHIFLFFFTSFYSMVTVAQDKSDSIKSVNNIQGCTLPNANEIFVGPSTIFEDSKPRFNTFGVNASIIHPLNSTLGITGDLGLNFGSQGGVDYTKVQLLGGISFLSVSPQGAPVSFYPHILIGSSYLHSTYKSNPGTYTNSSTNFSVAAGTDVSVPLNDRITMAAKADYNPSFTQGGVKHNFLFGVGLAFHFGCGSFKPSSHNDNVTQEKTECKASKITKELKVTLTVIKRTCDAIEEVANKIPRVEAKIDVKPELNVKRGEECCSADKPPVVYTELKGGVNGSCEVNINLWGLPDINFSESLWGIKLKAEFKLKLFTGPTGKIGLDGGGKFFGELGDHSRPDCKACYFFNVKAEGALRIGVVAGGSVAIYFGDDEPEKIGVSAEASASLVTSFTGSWGSKDCKKPDPGLHGTLKVGDGKANLKFNLDLGPLSFKPSYEVNLFDGLSAKVDVLFD